MPSSSESDTVSETESVEGTTEQTDEYSRRNFMQTAAAVGAAGAATGLAGCTDGGDGGGDGGTGGDGGDGGSDGTSQQDFLWWTMRGYIQAETDAIREAASGFEDAAEANVNLTTQVVVWADVFQEWTASLEGGSMPNVSEMACEHAVDFGNRGAAAPVTSLFNEYDDWYETVGNWGAFDGEFWGIPWFLELRTSHVNMDLLDQAGVNNAPENWVDLVNAGQAVAEETDQAGWVTPGARDFVTGQNLSAFNYQAGAGWYGYSDSDGWSVEADSAASLFTHLWTLSMREQWDFAPGGWGGVDGTAVEQLFREGRAAVAHMPTDLARSIISPQDGPTDGNEDLAEVTELTPMPPGPTGDSHSFMGGSCLSPFTEQVTQHNAGTDLKNSFMDYMIQPEQLNVYFPVSAPNFLPVRTGQEDMELFQSNPTELPDSWLETRLTQAPNSVRYGITDAERSVPFFGALEGSTTAYSTAISSIIGSGTDPKEALRSMGNNIRSTINDAEYVDANLEEKTEGPNLEDAPDVVQPWIEGDGVPQIHNPYA